MNLGVRPKWLVKDIGVFTNIGDVVKFDFKIPGHAKRIVGIFASSNDTLDYVGYITEVEICLNINNVAQTPIKKPFNLSKTQSKNFPHIKLFYLNDPLIAGQSISGYLKCIDDIFSAVHPTSVKLYIKYLTE